MSKDWDRHYAEENKKWEEHILKDTPAPGQCLISERYLRALDEYSASVPPGVFRNKRWRARVGPGEYDWVVREYVQSRRSQLMADVAEWKATVIFNPPNPK